MIRYFLKITFHYSPGVLQLSTFQTPNLILKRGITSNLFIIFSLLSPYLLIYLFI